MNIPQPVLRRRTFLGGLLSVLAVATVSDATKVLTLDQIEEKVSNLPEPVQQLSELVITPAYGLPQIVAKEILPSHQEENLSLHFDTNRWGASIGHTEHFVVHEMEVAFDGTSEDARVLRAWVMKMVEPRHSIFDEPQQYKGRAELILDGRPLVVVEDIFPTSFDFQGNGKMKARFQFQSFHQQVLT